jgi:hypothetical protein
MRSELTKSSGFATFLLKNEPNFPEDLRPHHGYIENFNGLGVFLHRHSQTG